MALPGVAKRVFRPLPYTSNIWGAVQMIGAVVAIPVTGTIAGHAISPVFGIAVGAGALSALMLVALVSYQRELDQWQASRPRIEVGPPTVEYASIQPEQTTAAFVLLPITQPTRSRAKNGHNRQRRSWNSAYYGCQGVQGPSISGSLAGEAPTARTGAIRRHHRHGGCGIGFRPKRPCPSDGLRYAAAGE